MITRRCRYEKDFIESHYTTHGWVKNQLGVDISEKGQILINQYYQLISGKPFPLITTIYVAGQVIGYMNTVDIDTYFYTVKEDRELKLIELGV